MYNNNLYNALFKIILLLMPHKPKTGNFVIIEQKQKFWLRKLEFLIYNNFIFYSLCTHLKYSDLKGLK